MKRSFESRGGMAWLAAAALAAALLAAVLWRHGRQQHAPAEPLSQALAPLTIAPLRDPETLIRPVMLQALGRDPAVEGRQRLDALRALPGDLTAAECEALLFAVLEARKPSVPVGWHSTYLHEICNVLQRLPDHRERFARVLATLAADASREEVYRDYALQHLRGVWRQADPGLRASIEASFAGWAAGEPGLAAPALLSLHLLDGGPDGAGRRAARVPEETIAPLVAGILSREPEASAMAARMTAIRVVAERRLERFLPELRRLVASEEGEHALVRMAAVSALARFEDPADRALLESLSPRDPRVRTAVRKALTHLP